MSVPLLAALMTVVVLALLLTRRRSPAEGDYEARLEAMRRQGGTLAAPATATAPERDVSAATPEDDVREEERLSYAPVGAPPIEHLELQDPLLGTLTFVGDEDGGEWETHAGAPIGIPGWITIEAGPEGPGERERACIEALAAEHADIIADAIAVAKRSLDLRQWQYEIVEPDSLRVGCDRADADSARGTLVLAIDGQADGRVAVTTTDGWKTLDAVID